MMGLTWILHETSHAGNVGSAARAIKTMGFEHLCLVNPKSSDMAKAPEAIALASGAVDVLDNTQVIMDLATACGPFSYVFGLSSRDREFGPPAISIQEACALAQQALSKNTPCAFLFGTERTGLRNEDFNYCSHRVWIDANPNYPSLNLAQAVMVCSYEMRQALKLEPTTAQQDVLPARASIESINALMDHLSLGLEAIEFLDPKHPKKLIDRLRALFDRAELQTEEVLLLRGVAKQMLLSKDKRFKL
jgi:tRNA/rRNA methyltransferase